MITKITSDKRHFNDHGWLKTYWLFSFSDYYDPTNMSHGRVRVFNDDIILPNSGFPTHPHEEMEIVTLVMNGVISHKDSMGNEGIIEAGDVQRMSAGTGLTHSEHNLRQEDLSLYQIWLYPEIKGVAPSYEQKNYTAEKYINTLFPVASGQNKAEAVSMNSNATIYRSVMDKGLELAFSTDSTRKILVYITYGTVTINDQVFTTKDQARIENEGTLTLRADEKTDIILIDSAA